MKTAGFEVPERVRHKLRAHGRADEAWLEGLDGLLAHLVAQR